MNISLKHLIISLILIQLFFSCEKDEFNSSNDANLVFSEDTIMFDTIFSSIGSSTKIFTVKNPYNKNIKISSINLAGGQTSPYRINIDGISGTRLENIELREKDSLYICSYCSIYFRSSILQSRKDKRGKNLPYSRSTYLGFRVRIKVP